MHSTFYVPVVYVSCNNCIFTFHQASPFVGDCPSTTFHLCITLHVCPPVSVIHEFKANFCPCKKPLASTGSPLSGLIFANPSTRDSLLACSSEKVPPAREIQEQAEFWVQYYNTEGKQSDFVQPATGLQGIGHARTELVQLLFYM